MPYLRFSGETEALRCPKQCRGQRFDRPRALFDNVWTVEELLLGKARSFVPVADGTCNAELKKVVRTNGEPDRVSVVHSFFHQAEREGAPKPISCAT